MIRARNEEIRQMRGRGLTLAAISAKVGVSRQRVAQILKGKRPPRPYVPRAQRTYWIYFIRIDRFIKVGITKDINQRLEGFKGHCPYDPELLHLMPGTRALEAHFLRVLRPSHYRLEWFHATPQVYALIADLESKTTTPAVASTPLSVTNPAGLTAQTPSVHAS